jgi:hypothetical protein
VAEIKCDNMNMQIQCPAKEDREQKSGNEINTELKIEVFWGIMPF